MRPAAFVRSLAVLAGVCLSAPSSSAETGHNAGFAETGVIDPASGQRAPVALWYPTRAAETAVRRGPYTLQVAARAPIAKGRFGLVVLSHGSGGSPITMRGTAAYLARHGYVVAAPLHPLNNFRDNSGPSSRVVLEGRPRTLSKAIDLVLGDLKLGGRPVAETIDRRRIAALGYSAGGAAVLALAGAVPVRAQAVGPLQAVQRRSLLPVRQAVIRAWLSNADHGARRRPHLGGRRNSARHRLVRRQDAAAHSEADADPGRREGRRVVGQAERPSGPPLYARGCPRAHGPEGRAFRLPDALSARLARPPSEARERSTRRRPGPRSRCLQSAIVAFLDRTLK